MFNIIFSGALGEHCCHCSLDIYFIFLFFHVVKVYRFHFAIFVGTFVVKITVSFVCAFLVTQKFKC